MSNDNDVLDVLPFGKDSDTPQKKKKTKMVRRMVKKKVKKKKAKPSTIPQLMEEPPETEEEHVPAVEPAEDWDALADDSVEEPVAEEPVAEAPASDLPGQMTFPVDQASEDEYDYADEEIPTPTGDQDGDAPESPVADVEQPGNEIPPAPEETVSEEVEVAAAAPAVSDINRKWDEFLTDVSDATRLVIWELGADSVTWFCSKTREDLMPPRGRLTSGQVDEIDNWLVKRGASLASRPAATIVKTGQAGSTVRRGGLRVQALQAGRVSAASTLGEKRNARLARQRLTM